MIKLIRKLIEQPQIIYCTVYGVLFLIICCHLFSGMIKTVQSAFIIKMVYAATDMMLDKVGVLGYLSMDVTVCALFFRIVG